MGTKLNRTGYEKLINENIEWLDGLNQPQSLERKHIVDVLRASVDVYYPADRGASPPSNVEEAKAFCVSRSNGFQHDPVIHRLLQAYAEQYAAKKLAERAKPYQVPDWKDADEHYNKRRREAVGWFSGEIMKKPLRTAELIEQFWVMAWNAVLERMEAKYAGRDKQTVEALKKVIDGCSDLRCIFFPKAQGTNGGCICRKRLEQFLSNLDSVAGQFETEVS